MATRKEWKARAKAAETALRSQVLSEPALTFDNLTICFADRTITYRGRVIPVETNCISFPLTNNQHLLARAGWYPILTMSKTVVEPKP